MAKPNSTRSYLISSELDPISSYTIELYLYLNLPNTGSKWKLCIRYHKNPLPDTETVNDGDLPQKWWIQMSRETESWNLGRTLRQNAVKFQTFSHYKTNKVQMGKPISSNPYHISSEVDPIYSYTYTIKLPTLSMDLLKLERRSLLYSREVHRHPIWRIQHQWTWQPWRWTQARSSYKVHTRMLRSQPPAFLPQFKTQYQLTRFHI